MNHGSDRILQIGSYTLSAAMGASLIAFVWNSQVDLVAKAQTAATSSIEGAPGKTSTTAIVLGVGSPRISASRSGTSIGIVASGDPALYLFDAGPGVVRRIMESGEKLAALQVQRIGAVFISHIHGDHTLGLPALLIYHCLSPLGLGSCGGGRPIAEIEPLTVYGPGSAEGNPSIVAMMEHIRAAFPAISDGRKNGEFPGNTFEIKPGVIYKNATLTVEAFEVTHIPNSYGFRIQTADRVIVISGDTRASDAVVDACSGCDLLFHEVYGLTDTSGPNSAWHTSATALAELARRARPKRLVLYHDVRAPEGETIAIIKRAFPGDVTFARDLDVF